MSVYLSSQEDLKDPEEMDDSIEELGVLQQVCALGVHPYNRTDSPSYADLIEAQVYDV